MATIGRRSAVVELPRAVRITGTLAWLAWLALHLFYLLGGRNRISTMINLSYRYLAWGHGGTVIVGDIPMAGQPAQAPSAKTGEDGSDQRSAPRQAPAKEAAANGARPDGARSADEPAESSVDGTRGAGGT